MSRAWHSWTLGELCLWGVGTGGLGIALLVAASRQGLPNVMRFLLGIASLVVGAVSVSIGISAAYAIDRRNAAGGQGNRRAPG